MSNIRITSNLHQNWLTAAKRLSSVTGNSYAENGCLPCPRPSQSEPYPEEFDDVLAGIAPLIVSGHLNVQHMAVGLTCSAASLGITAESLYPIYYLAGLGEIAVHSQDSTEPQCVSLRLPRTCGLPVIYSERFPIRISGVHQTTLHAEFLHSELNQLAFVLYEDWMMRPFRFTSLEQLTPPNENLVIHVSPQARAAGNGVAFYRYINPMVYSGCYRFPTAEELDALFTNVIRVDDVMNFNGLSYRDIFNHTGCRGGSLENCVVRDSSSEPAVPRAPQPSVPTNVAPQIFAPSTRPRTNPARNRAGQPRASTHRMVLSDFATPTDFAACAEVPPPAPPPESDSEPRPMVTNQTAPIAAVPPASGTLPASGNQVDLTSFNGIWRTIRQNHPNP